MRWVWRAVLLLMLLAGCAEQGPRLAVVPDRLELAPGEEERFVARLDGFEGEVTWSAEHGTIFGEGLEAVYRAPDYPVEDVVTVISKDDPRLRAEARVLVSSSGELGPRIEIAGDLAPVFTRIGEKHVLGARVYDAAGKLLADARPTFTSADPQSFAVEYDEDGHVVVTALSDKIQSVTITASYQGYEARAVAVFARLQPGVVRLSPGLLVSGEWHDGGWASLTLRRTPQTEALEPGVVFYGGDSEALWGRVDAVELADGSVTLITSPVRLQDVFRDLDYQASAPLLQARAEWREGRLLAAAADDLRAARFAACEALEADSRGAEGLSASVAVRLRITAGELQEGRVELDLEDVFSAAAALRWRGGGAECELAGWRVRSAKASLLLSRFALVLDSRLGVFADGDGAVLELPEVALKTRTRVVLHYQDGVWRPEVQTDPRLEPLAGAPRVEAGGELEAGLYRRLGVAFRLLLPGEDAYLARIDNEARLPWKIHLASERADESDYPGSGWRLDLDLVVDDGVSRRQSEQLLASSPQVWLETDPNQSSRLDLGSLVDDQAVRFSFGSTPQAAGEAEVWVEGGACEEVADCFDGHLRLLGRVEHPGGQVVWRPNKEERGAYRVYPRLRADDFSQVYPYAAEAQTIVVTGPDLSRLPLELTLRGGYGGPALGVVSYFNRPLWGVTPAGERLQLTSPLQVWIPANGLSADPASLVTPAGRWGYQQVVYRCPRTGQPAEQKLHLFSNDPEMAEVVLPVIMRCDASELPKPSLATSPSAGAAPLEVELRLRVDALNADDWCRLDFGDGGSVLEWEAGDCPREAAVSHVYDHPGTYDAVLLVGDGEGPRVLAREIIEVK